MNFKEKKSTLYILRNERNLFLFFPAGEMVQCNSFPPFSWNYSFSQFILSFTYPIPADPKKKRMTPKACQYNSEHN